MAGQTSLKQGSSDGIPGALDANHDEGRICAVIPKTQNSRAGDIIFNIIFLLHKNLIMLF